MCVAVAVVTETVCSVRQEVDDANGARGACMHASFTAIIVAHQQLASHSATCTSLPMTCMWT
jgi:hypothetical protein